MIRQAAEREEVAAAGRVRVLWCSKGMGAGGAERVVLLSARHRDRARVDGRVAYLLPHKDALVADVRAEGVEAVCVGGASARDPRWVLRLRRAIADADVGVVHSHSPVLAVAARVLIRTLPRRHRPVHVCTIHSLWGSKHPLTRAADRATARLDDASFAVSRAVASSLPAALRRRCEVLHHGVDVDAVVAAADGHRAAVRAELGIGDDELVVVTAANLRKQKGYPDLLAAAALVVAERPDVRFVTFGQGQQAEEVAAQHRASGLGDRFLLLGYRDDPARIVGAADVACLASVAEGFPLALVEAAVLGLPVVATEVGGIPEVVQRDETGVLVPPGRPDLLAEALLALLGDPDRRAALGRAAAERGQAMSIGAAVARYERCYEELVPSLGTTA